MKKFLILLFLSCFLLPFTVNAQNIRVYIEGEQLEFDSAPIIENGRTLVPMRTIFETLGAEVEWKSEINEIKATKDDKVILLRIGNKIMQADGVYLLDVAPKIVKNRTLIPIRAVSEALNTDVKWDNTTKTINISYKDEHFGLSYDMQNIEIGAICTNSFYPNLCTKLRYPIVNNPDNLQKLNMLNEIINSVVLEECYGFDSANAEKIYEIRNGNTENIDIVNIIKDFSQKVEVNYAYTIDIKYYDEKFVSISVLERVDGSPPKSILQGWSEHGCATYSLETGEKLSTKDFISNNVINAKLGELSNELKIYDESYINEIYDNYSYENFFKNDETNSCFYLTESSIVILRAYGPDSGMQNLDIYIPR